ncbi:hypothetical protein [Thiohalomonas denitrificans]|uniref:hypothetical protein n=1 Tax=Thiohalomonas denitrificans TaxID=415747 RepID=UPI0015867047|nr:hypothetical protein [Thiohalomonas denitrificans]
MSGATFSEPLTSQTAPAHPCARGIRASMHIKQGALAPEWQALVPEYPPKREVAH